ncbi:hypothetical protein B0H10DRAFT_335531 [Mycena sp. CBHHK59/15]|nr:hypothetical protein B0H10DRAFT_335531 [Mycena sp. CBHHK59/15]
MPSRRTSNARVNTGSNSQMLHNLPLNGPLYSQPASALPFSYPPLHLLQPPPAPHLRSVPLPHPTAAAPFTPARTPAPAAFPIDLTHNTDFAALAQVIPNYTLPHRRTSTSYLLRATAPSSRSTQGIRRCLPCPSSTACTFLYARLSPFSSTVQSSHPTSNRLSTTTSCCRADRTAAEYGKHSCVDTPNPRARLVPSCCKDTSMCGACCRIITRGGY